MCSLNTFFIRKFRSTKKFASYQLIDQEVRLSINELINHLQPIVLISSKSEGFALQRFTSWVRLERLQSVYPEPFFTLNVMQQLKADQFNARLRLIFTIQSVKCNRQWGIILFCIVNLDKTNSSVAECRNRSVWRPRTKLSPWQLLFIVQ